MRIGIFGGCFSPPHKMHKRMVLDLIEKDYVDKVIFVPTGDMYQKRDLASFNDRVEMLNLLIEGEKNLEVSRYEEGTLTYTYQTLDYFQTNYPDDGIYFICGSDNLGEIGTWREYEKILSNFKLLVIKRNNDDIDLLLARYNKYRKNIIVTDVLEEKLSSTYIRKCIEEEKIAKLDEVMDSDVLKYILEHGLYKK